MTVRFQLPDETIVDYGWDRPREPLLGEFVAADGSDPLLPEGIYRIVKLVWIVGIRGPRMVLCTLEWHAELPAEAKAEL